MLATVKRSLTGHPEALSRLAVPVNIVLIILLAYSLAGLSWRLLLPGSALAPPSVEKFPGQPSTAAAADHGGVDYTAIAGWHLFGQAPKAPPPAQPQKAPETSLNLKLAGTLATEGAGKALALIAEGSGPERVYKIGEAVPGGARLEQILRDRVVLYRNGSLEALSLPKEPDETRAPAPTALPPPGAVEYPEPLEPPDEAVAPAPSPRTIDASAVAGRLRNEVITRPEALQDLAVASPLVENGRFLGFRLRPGRDRQLFQQLGLHQGDVIIQVNGTPLTDPAQGLGLIQELLSANQVSLQVLRDGTEIPLTFILNK